MKRWLRAAIPFAALTALITGTLIVHAVETPDDDDPEYLTPQQVQQISGGTLAERLRARGIAVDRFTSTEQAVKAANSGSAAVTLFLATPDLADLESIRSLPAGSTIVAVNPSASALRRSGWPATVANTYWNTGVAAPICGDKIANDAGPAAVRKTEYRTSRGSVCYNGAVAVFRHSWYNVTLVGSPDPFRDDRIAEHGNATLVVGLLAQHQRVLWLDVHERDRATPSPTPPTPTRTRDRPDPDDTYDGPLRPGESYADDGYYDDEASPYPGDGEADGDGRAEGDSEAGGGGLPSDPLVQSLPPALITTLILLALILLALAIAAARRLGAPVAEPLPSKVPANETMLGHARLYQRARARDSSLDILRAAARRKLTTHLGLAPHADSEQIAHRAGLPVRYVRDILDRDSAGSNSDLVEAATLLQHLVRDVTSTPTPPHEGEQS
ncbi:hypothetical protein Ait01nite_012870 [Actinoplanes italicus]|uniref:DUF4350 domain-containing protein n=1 Tax=Actinoplanes italicus TaxID=113567 RepID=A0A2T0KH14_9ACTN|nr:DUF4350 domain-containing protein [Actinoplanes italicus]PRX22720.1 hypothetical protein CLV67_104248 [Actinoplanes italicus]GIE28242.1 hypothetical protein Ait01nite_012870 [Actinoplanes italicus]